MRIQFLSDLHLEFMPEPADFSIPVTDADVIVIAGDIGVQGDIRYIDWVLDETRGKPTVVVAGNHEPYLSTLQFSIRNWQSATRGTHVHFLEREVAEVGGARFLGATMYTDYELYGDRAVAMCCAEIGLNDHRLVRLEPELERFLPGDALQNHRQSRQFMEAELAKTYTGKTIVVTHHAPSPRSLTRSSRPEALAPAYASNLEALMARYEIAIWFHGHLHHSADYYVHHTHVLCNPRGYWPSQLNPDFDPAKVTDI